MEILLPRHINKENPVISTRTLVVIGTNGVGKSSFGKDLLKLYQEKAQNICGLHALFITTQEDKANADDW